MAGRVVTAAARHLHEVNELWAPRFFCNLHVSSREHIRRISIKHGRSIMVGGTRWCSWLRHCATIWKVTGSIPDGVIGISQRHNPSGRTMALELTQPLTEMSTRNIFWGGG